MLLTLARGYCMALLHDFMNDPQPVRNFVRTLVRKARLGSPKFRYQIGAIWRPHYAYLVYNAAQLAHRLSHDRVSVIEFGVAGGRGLLALEQHANWVETVFPVKIEIYGFDTGEGLPPPEDYRDLHYLWKPGFFRMDPDDLKSKLKRAKLVLGNVRETAKTFIQDFNPAPIGAVAQDFDYYSSTMDALKLFDTEDKHILPRVFCYFDDVIGDEIALYNDFTGERAAISDFNSSHKDRKLSPVYYLHTKGDAQVWYYQMWVLHNLNHRDYGNYVSLDDWQLKLDRRARIRTLLTKVGFHET
jgi:hypothetical protein